MSYDIFWGSSSFILTNDVGNSKGKKNLWHEFQATYTSTSTHFGCKIHLSVALIHIIVLQSFSLPHRQLFMCMLVCSDLRTSGAAPGQNPVCTHGGWRREQPQKSRLVLPSLCSGGCTRCVCIVTHSSIHHHLEVQPWMWLLLSCISTCSSKEVGPDVEGKSWLVSSSYVHKVSPLQMK